MINKNLQKIAEFHLFKNLDNKSPSYRRAHFQFLLDRNTGISEPTRVIICKRIVWHHDPTRVICKRIVWSGIQPILSISRIGDTRIAGNRFFSCWVYFTSRLNEILGIFSCFYMRCRKLNILFRNQSRNLPLYNLPHRNSSIWMLTSWSVYNRL